MSQKVTASRIAFAYTGTVVGAGFATGKEVFVFFTQHSVWGNLGIFLASALFVLLGYRMMVMGYQLQASSYHELNTYLFGPSIGKFFTLFVSIVLFGITSSMLSAIGALGGINAWVAHGSTLLVALLTYRLVIQKLKGILVVNTWVVPFMLLFTVVVSIFALPSVWSFFSFPLFDKLSAPMAENTAPFFQSMWDSLLYVSFNLATAQAVLVPLGASAKDRKTLRKGAILGGLSLGTLLWASQQCLQFYNNTYDWHIIDMPMATIMEVFHPIVYILFVLILIGEIMTTLVGNLYGLSSRCMDTFSMTLPRSAAILLILAYLCSLVGFSNIVEHIYPLLGYGGLGLCLALGICRAPNRQLGEDLTAEPSPWPFFSKRRA